MEDHNNKMDPLMNKQDPKDHLANERTLLAWMRTSIAIMAFGFVVVKFSLFVKQISLLLGKEFTLPQPGSSSIIGILLVGAGALVLVVAYINYKRTQKQLISQTFRSSSRLTLTLTLTMFIISILLIAYLIYNVSEY